MSRQMFVKLAVVLLVFVAFAAQGVQAVSTVFDSPPPVPPPNDNFANATVIGSLPFSGSVDNTQATIEAGEPQFCNFSQQTVWYSFTPGANALVIADMAGSSFGDTNLKVYQAGVSGIGDLSFLGCSSFGGSVSFRVQAGVTYYLQAGDVFNGGGTLRVNLQEVPPPPNDDFANAKVITALPFNDTVDTRAATAQAGEPTPSCLGTVPGTAWYAFTPAVSESISASANDPFSLVAAYTGTSLTSLSEVGCRSFFSGVLTFRANAGTTYYFQVAGFDPFSGGGAVLQFRLEVTPPPVANFGFSPGDPSVFDVVQFFDQSFDPGNVGVQSRAWNFGDGTSITTPDCCPIHQYAKDGDYTVKLTVTTFDGRTASTSQVAHVKTHDVAITKFSVPQSASSGQTRQIVVGLNSKRYLETVQVDLYKSTPNGYQFVGTLIQSVPVRSANRTTDFNFSYTFTSNDAIVGKVTFRAVATIIGARDALPADNEAISLPTKVTR